MVYGINNVTSVTLANITDIANFTTPGELFVKVNHIVYEGHLVFMLLITFWFILFVAAQKREKQPLVNAMYAGAIVSVVSFFFRAIQAYIGGDWVSLLTDYQMWIFPLTTILLAVFVWTTKTR